MTERELAHLRDGLEAALPPLEEVRQAVQAVREFARNAITRERGDGCTTSA